MADVVNWADAVEQQEQQDVTVAVGSLKVSTDTVPDEAGDVETTKAEASLLNKLLRTGLMESPHDVVIQQNDPNSPLYSAQTFSELNL